VAGRALRAAIRQSVRKFLDLEQYEVFIFGSEASGTAGRRSDIDVGILGPQPVPGAVLQHIRDELDTLRTLRVFEVVDFSRVDESFKTEALKHVERL
jgi:predicted nucleotidyltransferase